MVAGAIKVGDDMEEMTLLLLLDATMAATPAGKAKTPLPTIDLTRDVVKFGIDAPLVAAAIGGLEVSTVAVSSSESLVFLVSSSGELDDPLRRAEKKKADGMVVLSIFLSDFGNSGETET